jgi:uncharacterized protein (TIGR03083 family)
VGTVTFVPLERPDLPHQDLDVPALIAVWSRAMADFIAPVEEAGPEAWLLPTPCPGWSVGDLVAHMTSLERLLMKLPDPPYEPDWGSLQHVKSDFGWVTEVGVDIRRSRSRDDVLAEFADTMAARRAVLDSAMVSLGDEVDSPLGGRAPFDRVMRTRIFDTWAHEQDVRAAVNSPGNLDSPAAWVTADRLVGALGFVWAKRVSAPVGSSARVTVTGPGVRFRADVARLDGGRGSLVAPVTDPTVCVTLSWPDFVALGCGRVPSESVAGLADIDIDGDQAIGQGLVANLTITP